MQLYRVCNQYLSETGATYWIVYGTLLGYLRTGALLPGDYDVDFAAISDDFELIWENRNKLPTGFKMFDTSYRHGGPKLYIKNKNDWEADIYFYSKNSSHWRAYISDWEEGHKQPVHHDLLFPLLKVEFLGKKTNIPAKTVDFLKKTYGYIGPDAIQDKKTGYWKKQD